MMSEFLENLTLSKLINSIGLVFDILGFIILLRKSKYHDDELNTPYLAWKGVKIVLDIKRFRWGISFVLVGFILQLLSNWF